MMVKLTGLVKELDYQALNDLSDGTGNIRGSHTIYTRCNMKIILTEVEQQLARLG